MTHMTRNLLKLIMYKDTIHYDMQNIEVRSLFLWKFQIYIRMNRNIKKKLSEERYLEIILNYIICLNFINLWKFNNLFLTKYSM